MRLPQTVTHSRSVSHVLAVPRKYRGKGRRTGKGCYELHSNAAKLGVKVPTPRGLFTHHNYVTSFCSTRMNTCQPRFLSTLVFIAEALSMTDVLHEALAAPD